jgi:DNA-binding CsgD family transcriptional regulator
MDRLEGRTLGPYELEGLLGSGGFGAVYRATHRRMRVVRAVKILPPTIAELDPEFIRRLDREANLAAQLRHANIVQVHDVAEADGLHYIAMELVEGRSLRALLAAEGPLPLERARGLLGQLANALDYAHAKGVLHRDLKPANIIVGPDDHVTLLDFGLARAVEGLRLTASSRVLGTPEYMAPEAIEGAGDGPGADLYALGVLAYETLTGHVPFSGPSSLPVLNAHVHTPPPPPRASQPGLPERAEAGLLRQLAKDPSQRYATAKDFVAALGGESEPPPRSGAGQHAAFGGPAALPASADPDGPVLPPGHLPLRSPFVGREEELDFLKALYEAAAAGGGGRLVLIAGAPGVGKTRLARELGALVRRSGGVFLEGHYLREGNTPYLAWVEILRAGLRGLTGGALARAVGPYAAEMSQILPEMAAMLGAGAPAPSPAPEAQRRRFNDAVAEVIVNLARSAPPRAGSTQLGGLVVLLDDFHWSGMVTLLGQVARRLGDLRAVFLGTYREQELKERASLYWGVAELNRERLYVPMGLHPLTPGETLQMVAETLGADAAAALGERLHEVTRGNPFFVEETLRALVESGAVRHGGGAWRVVDPAAVKLPESMRLVIEERVGRLGEGARGTLIQAAVLGQEFGLEVLRRMTGLGEDALEECIERAVAARLLVDSSAVWEERFAFADEQVREALYDGLSGMQRRRLHLRAGRAIEAVHAERLEEHVEELARHFGAGGEPEKGADYAYRAAVKLDRVYVYSRALPYYRTALELWDQLGGHAEERAAASRRLAEAAYKATLDIPRGEGLIPEPRGTGIAGRKPTARSAGALPPMALTEREVEVLRLVAAGLADAEVAEKLVISPRTVNAHLRSIYGKLGVSSRTAATRKAVDQRLI